MGYFERTTLEISAKACDEYMSIRKIMCSISSIIIVYKAIFWGVTGG